MPHSTASDLIETKTPSRTRPSPLDALMRDAERAAQIAPLATPGHRWEGRLTGAFGSVENSRFDITAQLRFEGDGIEGDGSAGERWKTFTVNGWRGAAEADAEAGLQLDIWFDQEPLAGTPFTCMGSMSADGRRIEGKWFLDCLYPKECGCDGGGGAFWLQRVG